MLIPFPEIVVPPLILHAGTLLNVNLLGISLQIPPWDITIPFKLMLPPTLMEIKEELIIDPIKDAIAGVAQSVVDLMWAPLNTQLEAYYGALPAPEEPAEEEEEPTPPTPTPPPVYPCPFCSEEFLSVTHLREHIRTEHPEYAGYPVIM